MSQTLHIVKKDLRRLGWPLAVWVFLIAGRVLLATVGPSVALESFGEQFVVEQLKGIVWALETLMLAFLVARLVHEEPLVGLDAFWLTRPVDRRSLLGAKLLLGSVAFILAPIVGDLIVMAAFDARARDMLRAAPAFLQTHASWMLGLMVVAVLTPSFAVFALTIIGAVGMFSLLMVLVMAVAMLVVDESSSYTSSLVTNPTPALVATIVYVCASLAVIVYQYRHRRLTRALGVVAAGIVALMMVPQNWPWSLARPPEPDPGAWARDPIRSAAVIDLTEPPQIGDAMTLRRAAAPTRHVSARVRLTGMPPQYGLQSVAARARLQFPDGTTLQSEQMGSMSVLTGRLERAGDWTPPLQAALGDVRLPPLGARDDGSYESWPALLTITDEEYARYGREAGRLTATLHFHLQRTRVIGVLPLVEGAALDGESTRTEIVRVLGRPDGYILVVRQWHIEPLLGLPLRGSYQFVLRNSARREALTSDSTYWGPDGGVSFGAFSHALGVGGISFGRPTGRGFVVNHYVLEFPARWRFRAPRHKIDAAWLAGADLAIVETAYAGRVTRSLTVEGFRIQAAP